MESVIRKIENKYKKSAVVDVRSGDNVRVHQKIVEGGKERVQIFEGLVIRVNRKNSLSSSFTVRRIASGVGVEKTYLIHSPNILKIEVTKRSRVRRNYLSYMRERTGKRARLTGVDFDKNAVNEVRDEVAEAEEAKIQEKQAEEHEAAEAKKEAKQAKQEAKAEAAIAEHEAKAEPQKAE
ncbi:50S ribosomal protein L19 [Candidatus Saccharibacteria bacterium]|nr:50S ribosomal protein L19 [Candidatus Saccharibacteria bacterium]